MHRAARRFFCRTREYVAQFIGSSQKGAWGSFAVTFIVVVVVDMQTPNFLAAVSRQSYYRYIRVTRFFKKRRDIRPQVESLNSENAGQQALGFLHLDDAGLYSSWTLDAALVVRAASKYARNLRKADPFQRPSHPSPPRFTRAESVSCVIYIGCTRMLTRLQLRIHRVPRHVAGSIVS